MDEAETIAFVEQVKAFKDQDRDFVLDVVATAVNAISRTVASAVVAAGRR
jgi:hypothetical protein